MADLTITETPVFWFDLCAASLDSSQSWLRRQVLNRMAASHSCQVDHSQHLSLILLSCWGLFLVVSRLGLPAALLRLLYPNHSGNGGHYRLHRPGSWLQFRLILLNCSSAYQFFLTICLYDVAIIFLCLFSSGLGTSDDSNLGELFDV